MPIRVSVRFHRKGAYFLAGEQVSCVITFANESGEPGAVENLAWSSVQLHCQEVINDHKVRIPPSKLLNAANTNKTSFAPTKNDPGRSLFASKPKILYCDLRLRPDESKSYHYSDSLPIDDVPPSFRGQAVKYLYKLTVGTQRVGAPIKLLRVPLKVLAIPGLSGVCLDEHEFSPTNPFLAAQPNPNKLSIIDLANELIETLTAVRQTHFYNITNDRGKVAKLTLFKSAYKLGEDVVGHFEFSGCDVQCVQFAVSLQIEEEVTDECRAKADQSPLIQTVSKTSAVCADSKQMEFSLAIPVTAPPVFFTDLVTVRWKLHFEFVVAPEGCPKTHRLHADNSVSWSAPESVEIQSMIWELPIKVYACSPLNACLGTFAEAEEPLLSLTF